MTKVDFFISYTKVDEEWAKWIAWEIKKQGFTCIIQAWDFTPARSFIDQMNAAIKRSKQTIAVLSPEYLKSKYAVAEMNAALADDPRGGKLVPVRIRPCRLPGLMRDKVYIDLVGKPPKIARSDLVAGIEASRIGINQVPGGIKFRHKPSFPGVVAVSEIDNRNAGAVNEPPNPLRILFLASEAGTGLDLRGQYRKISSVIKPHPMRKHSTERRF